MLHHFRRLHPCQKYMYLTLYDQNFFRGGRGGGWGGDSSERRLKWGGMVGVIKGSFQKHLKKRGGLRQKLFVGEGF